MQGRSFTIMAIAALLLGSCGVPKNRFRLNGKFKNIRSADIFIYAENSYDTLHIRDGKFRYERDLREPEVLTVQYPDFSQRRLIAEPGTEAKFTTDASDLTKTRVTGTEENELLTQFYSDINGKRSDGITDEAVAFVNQHPQSLAAQVVFEDYILKDGNTDGTNTLRLLKLMLKRQPHNARLSRIAGRVTPLLSTLPGAKAPDFNVKSFKGTDLSLKTFAGKYLLISYWASWQYDSFQQIRRLKGTVKPFRGRLGLINVCLDYDIRSFRNTLTRDTLPEYNVCDKLVWDSPLARLYGVSRIPGNVLISPDGKIVARDIKDSDLGARLSKLMP